jgi:VCBS repeat-containing protein
VAGTLTAADVDDSDGFQADAALVGTYGTGTIDAAGNWTYTVDDANPTVDALNAGDTLIDTITVLTVDGTSQDITVTIQGANDAPVLLDQTLTVTENTPNGTPVGVVAASDVEAGSLVYTIQAGNIGGAFAIDSATGDVTVANAAALDHETMSSFGLTVEVRDSEGLASTAVLTIDVSDLNEAPTVSSSTLSVLETAANGAMVGAVSADDPDAGDTLSYAIVGGNVSGSFSIDPATGEIRVANAAALDATALPSYDLTVEVRDSGTLTDTAVLTIEVANDLLSAPDDSEPEDEAEEGGETPIGDGEAPEDDPGGTDDEQPALQSPPPLVSELDSPDPQTASPFHALGEFREGIDASRDARISFEDDSEFTTDEDAEAIAETPQQALAARLQLERQLDLLRQELGQEAASDAADLELRVGAAEGALAGMLAGALALLARGSTIVAAMLSSLPMWRGVDPLAVLGVSDERREALAKKLQDEARREAEEAGGLAQMLDGAEADAPRSGKGSSGDLDSDLDGSQGQRRDGR